MFEVMDIDRKNIFILESKDIYKGIINTCFKSAILKTHNTYNSWKKRNKNEIFYNLIVGDVAKKIIDNYLKQNGITCIDYDEIRNDNFTSPDHFDLKYNNIQIEVKSSIEKYTLDLNTLLNNRRIINNHHHNHINKSDVIIQVFFMPSKLNMIKHLDIILNSEFSKESTRSIANFVFNHLQPMIVGWTTKSNLTNNDCFSVNNDYTDERKYSDLKLKDTFNIDLLPNTFNEMQMLEIQKMNIV